MKWTLLFFTFAFNLSYALYSQPQIQEIRKLKLDEAIHIALVQSPDALNAKQTFRANFWEYKSFKASYLPALRFNAVLPEYNRSIQKITFPDGTEGYVQQQYTNLSGTLSLNQQIGFSGGNVFLSSGLQRTENFSDTSLVYFLSTPINIGLTQPLFQFNQYRWDRKIQPMNYEQAKRKYLEDVEQIAITTVNYFFSLLQAQIEKKIAHTNLHNYDTLFRIAQGRYQLGKIAENYLLQLELNFLKAQAAVDMVELHLGNALFQFKSFLRIQDSVPIELIPPSDIQFFSIDPDLAVQEANKNTSASLNFNKRLLEATRDVNKARWEGRFDAELTAVFGLTQQAHQFADVYKNPLDQQQVAFSVNIPLLDWGVAKGKIKMAQSEQEIIRTSVEQEIIDFQQNIYLKVMQFNMQQKQVMITAKSDTVARKSYYVTKGRYFIGKINSILDLNNAQIETDNAQKAYYLALQSYWRNYYEIRKLTLYDFKSNTLIPFSFLNIKM